MTQRTCSFEGCEGKHVGNGLCGSHRMQTLRGVPLTPIARRPPRGLGIREKLELLSRLDDATGCRLWTEGLNGSGYAMVSHAGETRRAHRVIWELENGPIPDGLRIDHMCRNRNCIEVSHLQLANAKTNGENSGISSANRSGYRGVWYDRRTRRWAASLKHNYKKVWVGRFKTAEEAHEAVKAKRLELFTNNLLDRVERS